MLQQRVFLMRMKHTTKRDELTVGTTDVSSYYTYSPASYVHASDKAVANTTYYWKKTVKGADIRGNVYGGGNAAEVTGDTNVVIGKSSD